MAQQKAVDTVVDEVDDLIDELQPGAKLLKGQYTITRYLNSGGFGITYLAKDSLDRDVVIKECFPSSVCRRSKVMVAARSRAHTAELRSVVQLFVREARNLAKIVHPNIVAVHQVFEDNGTAYMAIDYIDGLDLQQVIDGEGPQLTPDHIVRVTDKLLAAVGFIHDNDMLHRDISPDNVLIDQKGEPILIDFGAAREKASQSNRAMSALRVVKDGYSPQEFYIAGSEQGPWSDLYALGATIYHLISGDAPMNGQARLAALAEDRPDPYTPLAGRFAEYPAGFLEAIDRAMSTLPKHRLQTAAAWLAMYHTGAAAEAVVPAGVDDAVHRMISDFQSEGSVAATESPSVVPARVAKSPSRPSETGAAAVKGGSSKSPVQLLAGVAVALVVVAGGYMILGGREPAPAVEGATVATTAAEPANTIPATTDPKPADTVVASADVTATQADPVKPVETASAEPVAPSADSAPSAAAADPQPTITTADAKPVEAVAAPASAEPAVEAVAEVAPVETAPVETAPVEPATAETEPAGTAPADTATADTATADTATADTATADTATVETATVEPAIAGTATVAATEAATAKPSPTQIGFAAWDVVIPFGSDNRMLDGKRVAIVTRVPPADEAKAAGDWLAPGVLIYAVNGAPIQTSGSLTAAVLNAMAVDPDGKARVVVEYSDGSRDRKTGLLTVGAVRLLNLQNGVGVRTLVVDGVWKTEVTGVARPELTTLRQGDILFRDKTTTTALDGPNALEAIIADLIAQGRVETEFAIIRDNKVSEARMALTLDRGQ